MVILKANHLNQLNEVEQNIVICQWGADHLFVEAEGWGNIDLRDTDK